LYIHIGLFVVCSRIAANFFIQNWLTTATVSVTLTTVRPSAFSPSVNFPRVGARLKCAANWIRNSTLRSDSQSSWCAKSTTVREFQQSAHIHVSILPAYYCIFSPQYCCTVIFSSHCHASASWFLSSFFLFIFNQRANRARPLLSAFLHSSFLFSDFGARHGKGSIETCDPM
jgi:hypothetical protein